MKETPKNKKPEETKTPISPSKGFLDSLYILLEMIPLSRRLLVQAKILELLSAELIR